MTRKDIKALVEVDRLDGALQAASRSKGPPPFTRCPTCGTVPMLGPRRRPWVCFGCGADNPTR